MLVELYTAPSVQDIRPAESPVSSPIGELPDQEPDLLPDQLLGSFDSREEAIMFAKEQLVNSGQSVTDTQSGSFNEHTHIEWLTLTTTQNGASTHKTYYLVTDEGY